MSWENVLKEDDWTDLETENQGSTFNTNIAAGLLISNMKKLNDLYDDLIDISKQFDDEPGDRPDTEELATILGFFDRNLEPFVKSIGERIGWLELKMGKKSRRW